MQIISNLTFTKIAQIGVGQGLNSVVWLAKDHQLGSELAIKEIDKTTFWNPDWFAEAKIVYAVLHQNVVAVQYGCELGNSAYIAMPYYPNGSMTDELAIRPLGLSDALSIAHGVLLGLEHIHIRGYLHLDIKPSNIFFDQLRRPLIADFGQARIISSGGLATVPKMYAKSMPPEVLLSGNAAAQSDIYQVGLLLYRALNGEPHLAAQLAKYPTIDALRKAIIRGKYPDRSDFLPHVPKRLRTVLRKAMNTIPTQRFSSASGFSSALGKVRLKHDWSVEIKPSDEIEWSCTQIGRAGIVVELTKAKSGWRIAVYTENGNSVRRAKGKDSLWGKFATRAEALSSLIGVFESL